MKNKKNENNDILSQKPSVNKDSERKTILSIVYIFVGLFVLMMGYFAYFLLVKSDDVINSTYNLRHDVLAKRVVRGKIMSADGKVLAETIIDNDENEIRSYPYGDMYAHLVGRVMRGRTGIEEVENITLLTSYSNSAEAMYNDIVGVKNPGNNVVSTLNHKLTQVAYDALGNDWGAVVAIEPKTGKILAMVSKPSYDPNDIDDNWEKLSEDKDNESPLLSRASQGLYPPGSTFKIITALAYIRANPNYMDYSYKCNGSTEYEGMTINCSNKKAHGNVDLKEAFAKSCNTAFSTIGKDILINDFRSLSESFFFNQPLPARIANYPSSFLLKVGESGVKETMQTAIGQGRTLISPLHNAMIAAAVANGGVIMKPYAIDRIESAGGRVLKGYIPEEAAVAMTSKEADYLKSMMRSVVTDGTASRLKNFDYKIAGKTGTAEQEGKDSHAWFIGFAPANDPKIAISVIVENKGSGSEYALPIAGKVFDAYFN
ncbi:MAG: penicillin-binding protein 2 [Anaerolineaceae bacterium]|nr:MAG: penicillin-binding protein 2 [Anaerolineaceae bacterium]